MCLYVYEKMVNPVASSAIVHVPIGDDSLKANFGMIFYDLGGSDANQLMLFLHPFTALPCVPYFDV